MSTLVGLDDLKAHVGRRESADDVVTAAPANLLRLTFGRRRAGAGPGDPLPPGWQCLYFLPRFAPDALRPDGSPLDTGVIPPMPLPRRMFAGERFRFHRPLRIGETMRRETELADISIKAGGTGTLVFATVVQRIFTRRRARHRGGAADRVPRGGAGGRAQPGAAPRAGAGRRAVAPPHHAGSGAALPLLRAHVQQPPHPLRSALGDGAGGLPGLVVHGPLTSTLLIDFARDHTRGRAFATYETQARAPLFDTAPFELRGRPSADGRGVELWAVTPDGTVAMSARAELA